MRRDRFTMMLKFLHINDNSMYKKKGEPGHDSLFKIRPFLEQLFHNFQAAYTLHREISVDETMISYKGRIGFIQYMREKPIVESLLHLSNWFVCYNWHLYTDNTLCYKIVCFAVSANSANCRYGIQDKITPTIFMMLLTSNFRHIYMPARGVGSPR